MKEHIIQYYLSERLGAIIWLVLSITLLVLSLILWKYPTESIQRGIAMVLLIAGSFLTIATTVTILHNNKRIDQTKTAHVSSNKELQQTETQRMEKVISSAYIAGLTIFSLSLLSGLVMIMINNPPFRKGIGWGLFLFGILGVAMELISMKNNKAYLNTIKSIEFKNQQ